MGAMTRHQKWCDTCGRELADDLTMANTMANMVAYNPDFIVDLGDTFMTNQNFGNGLFEIQNRQRGAPIRQEDMVGDYLLLRRHLSQSAFTVPLFLVLGNHDAERWAVSSSIGSRKRSNRATLRSSSCFSIVSSGGYDSPFGGSRGGHIYAEYFEYVKTVEDCDVADCSYVADTYTIPAN